MQDTFNPDIPPPKLAAFVNATRVQRNKGTLSAERIAKLDAVGFVWQGKTTKILEDGISEVWKKRFDELLQFRERNGNFKVPSAQQGEYAQLGNWVSQQRQLKKRNKLHPERVRLLDEAGFEWVVTKKKIH